MKRVCSKLSLHAYMITTGMQFFFRWTSVHFDLLFSEWLSSEWDGASFLLIRRCKLGVFLSESLWWSRLRCWCTGAQTGPHAPRPFWTHADVRNPAASSFTTATVWRCSTHPSVRKRSVTTLSTRSPRVSMPSCTGVRTDAGIHTDRWMFPNHPGTRRQH